MTLAILDSARTAAIRIRYSQPVLRQQPAQRERRRRSMTEPEDNWLRRYGATTPIRVLCKQLNRDRHMVERRLKALGITPVLERADRRRKP